MLRRFSLPHLTFRYLSFFSNFRMNLYIGGPIRNAIKIKTKKISFHPITKIGSQASVLNTSALKPARTFLFIDYFNIGILMP